MKELLTNIKQFWNSAELVYKSKDYTSATILYFKCMFVLIDLIIFKTKNFTPKDHTERFRILQNDFPNLYEMLDKTFSIYRDTYSYQIEEFKCIKVRQDVIKITKEQGIELNTE